jgi:hypothetical protein
MIVISFVNTFPELFSLGLLQRFSGHHCILLWRGLSWVLTNLECRWYKLFFLLKLNNFVEKKNIYTQKWAHTVMQQIFFFNEFKNNNLKKYPSWGSYYIVGKITGYFNFDLCIIFFLLINNFRHWCYVHGIGWQWPIPPQISDWPPNFKYYCNRNSKWNWRKLNLEQYFCRKF